MKTLNAPLFELNPESKYYKTIKIIKDSHSRINEILREIASEFDFKLDEFSYYGSRGFGFKYDTEAYEKFENQLTKKPDRNGIHTFKKTTAIYKLISPKMVEVDKILSKRDPFGLHDIFGFNNLAASQWIKDRYFVEVKSEAITREALNSSDRGKRFEVEPVMEASYKDYLLLITEEL